jgi:hypothetical protein
MYVDDLLFMIIIGGMVLSVSYLRAQYMMQRSYRIAERGAELRLRELYGTRPDVPDPLEGSQQPPMNYHPLGSNALSAKVPTSERTARRSFGFLKIEVSSM